MLSKRPKGKVERLIRTINERLRANKNIILEQDNTGLSEMLYALRSAKRPKKLCSAELHNNRKFTTVKDIITTKPNKNYIVSENNNNFQLELSDFPGEQDSAILVRERARGTKLDRLYKKKKGVITNETDHTITSNKKRQSTTYSKRDVAIPNEAQASTSNQSHENYTTNEHQLTTKNQSKTPNQKKLQNQQIPKKKNAPNCRKDSIDYKIGNN